MQIDDATTHPRTPVMSAFPYKVRPFTEPISAVQDEVIGPGHTVPDLIRKFYPGAVPFGFAGKFGFLDRDNKERIYDPQKEDPFVFSSLADIGKFKRSNAELIELLNNHWVSLDLPLKKDEARKMSFPDSSILFTILDDPGHPDHKKIVNALPQIYFILGNIDILKKTCVVRNVCAGWWIVSYRGKKSVKKDFFKLSLSAHKRAIKMIVDSPKYKSTYDTLWSTAGDPLDTNPGYPFYTGNVDKEGNPTTRILTVEVLKEIGLKYHRNWADVLKIVDERCGKYGMAGYPFCVAPIRRLSPGYKPQHQFTVTPSGMRSAYDAWGTNSQRVAWMVPYVYNILLTPFQIMMKAVRSILPGLYHDGPSKIERTKVLQKARSQNTLFMAEADYSNYDRFIPIDIMEEIINVFAELTDAPTYWKDAAMYLHKDASLVWPDYSSVSDGNGWLFKPGQLGLMSGVKATSEAGTFVNSIVNAEALARTFNWNEDQLVTYLTQYLTATSGTKFEYYYIASDDTELIQKDPSSLAKQGKFFMEATKAAGLKGSMELADRFLMRQVYGGDDRPVPARVFQNTISNETPPDSEVVFLAGLASRTDGLLGIKTVDPFATGKLQKITLIEAQFTVVMIEKILTFIKASKHPSKIAIDFLTKHLTEADSIKDAYKADKFGYFTPAPSVAMRLTEIRTEVSQLLAKHEASRAKGLTSSWLYDLFRDRNVPSSQLVLDQLIKLNPQFSKIINSFEAKEHSFFLYASQKIGIDPISISH